MADRATTAVRTLAAAWLGVPDGRRASGGGVAGEHEGAVVLVSGPAGTASRPAGLWGYRAGRLLVQPWPPWWWWGGVGGEQSRVTKGVERMVLVGQQAKTDDRVVVGGPCSRGELDGSDQPGLRPHGQVSPETVLTAGTGLVDVPAVGIDGGDDRLGRGAPTGPPAAVPTVGTVRGFDVLARDQSRQPDRVRRFLPEILLGQTAQQPQRVTDEGVDQDGPGLLVVPGDPRLARRREPCAVHGSAATRAAPGTSRITARIADTNGVTVSWVATASSSTVESRALRCLP